MRFFPVYLYLKGKWFSVYTVNLLYLRIHERQESHELRPMAGTIRECSTADLQRLQGMTGVCLIDIRPVDAYNGWKLRNEARGGHIPGARSLPAKWANYIDWIETVRQKKILPGEKIILYGYDDSALEQVANRFIKTGYPDVSVYRRFIDEWASRDEMPLEFLPRYRHLVPASWVHRKINGLATEHPGFERFIILHVHYRNREAYLSGHIPGAIDIDTLAVETPGDWNRCSPPTLKSVFEAHGITADTTVIVYGKYMDPDHRDAFPGSAAGDIGAMRVASILMYAGVKDVRTLNGGFQSWSDEGLDISYSNEPKKPVADFGGFIPAHPELIIDLPEAREYLASPDAALVCVRSWPEYIGAVSGYHYIDKKGRIPGALFADGGSDAYHMEHYRNPDLTCREYHEISANWKKNGIVAEKRLAFYCGTGWRGSEAWFNAWLMGWPRVSVYDGGWLEWSADPANPVNVGIPVQIPALFSPEISAGARDDAGFLITNLLETEKNAELVQQLITGLTSERKYIPSHFFYDEKGSLLFEQITTLPEYYPTRTELSILKTCAASIPGDFSTLDIIELGSGNSAKIAMLLDAISEDRIGDVRYFPVDVSKSALTTSAVRLKEQYPALRVHAIVADFMKVLPAINGNSRQLFCFFGSTIGNMDIAVAHEFLLRIKKLMKPGDVFLLGLDMVKDRRMLHDAYNDRQGITAAFNLNILNAVNALAGTGFNISDFEHQAVYNEDDHRVEMYLVAKRDMGTCVPGFDRVLSFHKGERIHTENSHKYTAADIEGFSAVMNLTPANIYVDPPGWFSLVRFVNG